MAARSGLYLAALLAGGNIDEDEAKVLFFTQPKDEIVLGGTWARCKLREFKRPVSWEV